VLREHVDLLGEEHETENEVKVKAKASTIPYPRPGTFAASSAFDTVFA
jgi:hypothetical protein